MKAVENYYAQNKWHELLRWQHRGEFPRLPPYSVLRASTTVATVGVYSASHQGTTPCRQQHYKALDELAARTEKAR